MSLSRILQGTIAAIAMVLCVLAMTSIPSEARRQSVFLEASNCNTTKREPCIITEAVTITSRSSSRANDGRQLCSITITDSQGKTYETIIRHATCPVMSSATTARLTGDTTPRALKFDKEIYSMNVAELSLASQAMLIWVLSALSMLALKLRLSPSPVGGLLALQPMAFMCHMLLLGGLGFMVARNAAYLGAIGAYLLTVVAIECALRTIVSKKAA